MIPLLLKSIARALSSPRDGRRLCILTYHRVLADADPLRPSEPTARSFTEQLRVLRRAFHLIRLDEAVRLLKSGRLPARALSITFDDGYLDNLEVAAPILRREGAPATFFIATGFMPGGAMFNDQVIEAIRSASEPAIHLPWAEQESVPLRTLEEKLRAIDLLLPIVKKIPPTERQAVVLELAARMRAPARHQLMMSPSQVRELASFDMEIGAHTVHHPILSSLADDEARREIATSKQELEKLIGRAVVGFAFPNGRPGRDYQEVHAKMAEEAGFEYAVSTRWASVGSESALFELPRVAPWGGSASAFAARAALSYRAR